MDVASAVLWIFPLLFAVVLHEFAHGWAAARLGDDTAARLGRLTLNPLAHVDLVGTIVMPALLFMSGSPFLFGYAKPVPVDWTRLRDPRRDMVWVAAAGPAMNMLLAIVSAIMLGVLLGAAAPADLAATTGGGFAVVAPMAVMAQRSVVLNVVLAVFNLLPIPPLDGGRVAVGLLPDSLARPLARVEPFGFLLVFGLLISGMLGTVLGPVVGIVIGMLEILV